MRVVPCLMGFGEKSLNSQQMEQCAFLCVVDVAKILVQQLKSDESEQDFSITCYAAPHD